MSVQLETPRITREQALEIAEHASEILKTRFGATRVIVFGSARGDAPWHEGSDLDLAVESIHDFWGAYKTLRELMPLGLDFDLVELEYAYPEMRARILEQISMPKDPILALANVVKDELKTLERTTNRLTDYLAKSSESPTAEELDAMALKLHQFYSNVESIFERIATAIDRQSPKGERWHSDLLSAMLVPVADKRPAVINLELWKRLDDLLDFRHFVRHGYSQEMRWDKMSDKVEQLPETFEMLRAELDTFFAALDQMKKDG